MAIRFANGNQYIRTSVNFEELPVATVCFWVNFDNVAASQRILGTRGSWQVRIRGRRISHELRAGNRMTFPTVLSNNVWYHISLAYDGFLFKYGAIDAVLDAVEFSSFSNTATLDFLSIGTATNSPTGGSEAQIEDVRIYNRVLFLEEVAEIANNRGKDRIYDGLQHWWTLNGGHDNASFINEPDLVSGLNMTTAINNPVYISSNRSFIHDSY